MGTCLSKPDTNIHAAAAVGDVQAVRQLLKRQSSLLRAVDKEGQTALHMAVRGRQDACVRALLDAGASPDAADKHGMTALHRASAAGLEDSLHALLAAGASPEVIDKSGWTALHHAAAGGQAECLRALLARGANVAVADMIGGQHPLHRATMWGHDNCVRILLEAGADVNATDKYNDTPLHMAVRGTKGKCLLALLAAGADTEVQDRYGKRPLHLAAAGTFHEQLDFIRHLAAAGADLSAPNGMGKTAYQVAESTGHDAAAALLQELAAAAASSAKQPQEDRSSSVLAKPPAPATPQLSSLDGNTATAAEGKYAGWGGGAPISMPRPATAAAGASRECRVCLEPCLTSSLRVLVPCGHNPACAGCTVKLLTAGRPAHCPICRTKVLSSLQVYDC